MLYLDALSVVVVYVKDKMFINIGLRALLFE